VTWGTPVQSFVFPGLLVFELEPMYATSDRRTTDADHRLMPPPPTWPGHNNNNNNHDNVYGAVIMAEPLREFTRFI